MLFILFSFRLGQVSCNRLQMPGKKRALAQFRVGSVQPVAQILKKKRGESGGFPDFQFGRDGNIRHRAVLQILDQVFSQELPDQGSGL
jgi:hypothetical protein